MERGQEGECVCVVAISGSVMKPLHCGYLESGLNTEGGGGLSSEVVVKLVSL